MASSHLSIISFVVVFAGANQSTTWAPDGGKVLDKSTTWAPDGGDVLDKSLGLVDSAISAAKDPTMKSVGAALGSLGGIAAVTIPPPAGLVVGGVMGLAGIFMGAFGGGGPSGPSNQQLSDQLSAGFQEIDLKLDELMKSLDVLQQKMDLVLSRVTSVYADIHLYATELPIIDAVYSEIMRRAFAAQIDPDDIADLKSYSIAAAEQLAIDVDLVFDYTNVLKLIKVAMEQGGVNDGFSVFQQVVASRFKLYSIRFSAQLYKHGRADALLLQDTEILHTQMQQYNTIFETYHGFGCHNINKPESCSGPCRWIQKGDGQGGCFAGTCTAPQVPNAESPACEEGSVIPDSTDCYLMCKSGYHARVDAGYTADATCHDGTLSAAFQCVPDGRTCSAPQVSNAESPACEEGSVIPDTRDCYLRCKSGYRIRRDAGYQGLATCHDGTFDAAFQCVPDGRSCSAPQVANAESPPCTEGYVIPDGSACLLMCKSGYHALLVAGYSYEAACQDGTLDRALQCVADGSSLRLFGIGSKNDGFGMFIV